MKIEVVIKTDDDIEIASMPEEVLRQVFIKYNPKLEKPFDKALLDLKESLRKL